MLARCLGPLAAALLLGLLLLDLPAGHSNTDAPKAGVCPKLPEDQNCTVECVSDRNCTDNLKCCHYGCASLCVLPNAPSPERDKGIAEEQSSGATPAESEPFVRDGFPGVHSGTLFRGRGAWACGKLGAGSEKPGFCPNLGSSILPLGFCHDQCNVDSDCSGPGKCCVNGCGKLSCATPTP
ncbi:PREDICTED: WAP four-disulfide core domain protein 2 [Elephantulus edwardii]|uniref:WAP four-disulfide core domain protein 2 n=1 Tax=Elephantulus edwardii TaxID=28737 RepID=UPI0003F06D2E|nr:PREDICTED: WAP four-disulfide core domain protein 2 [Elephantulus edwardii]